MKRTFFLISSLFITLILIKILKPTKPKKETTDNLLGRIDYLWDDLERRMIELKDDFRK